MRIKLLAVALAAAATAAQAEPVRHIEGRNANGANYVIDVPADWNGTVLLFSRGYSGGPGDAARNAARKEKDLLLALGYALAGTAFSRSGWALEEAVPDQLATLDAFAEKVGKPKRTIAWGTSMGGLITIALIERYPQRFDGGLALCASAAGTPGMMNAALDGAFAFKTLVAPGAPLPILFNGPAGDGKRELLMWQQHLDAAQATPEGRARIALAATFAQVPPWIEAGSAQPRADDTAAQQRQLYRGLLGATLLPRDDQLRRAGANFSWNTGVDYAAQLAKSGRAGFVRGLYREAGLELDSDLDALAAAPRIAADPSALAYMKRNYAPTGQLAKPMLLVQTVADPVTLVEMTGEYARLARAAGADAQVREAYVQRVGHCNFKPGETAAAIMAVERRAASGSWDEKGADTTSPASLNALAASMAPDGADYVAFRPAPFLRACSGAPRVRCVGEPTAPPAR